MRNKTKPKTEIFSTLNTNGELVWTHEAYLHRIKWTD
jgi:hypothetical protein